MAAVLAESVAPVYLRERAPQGPGNDLLDEWGLWMRGGLPGGGSGEWNIKERLDPPHDEDMPEKVLIVEGIIGRLGVDYPNYRKFAKHYWVGGEHPWQIAGLLCYTEGFVWMSLRAIADVVEKQYDLLTSDAVSTK